MKSTEPDRLDPRDRMMGEIAEGMAPTSPLDHSDQCILARGCDSQMAARASVMLPPHLGYPVLVSATDDDDFISKLRSRQWSVVFFAPGACRYDEANLPIPGSRAETRSWGLAEYRALVRTHQGEDTPVVETTDEREIIPLLLRALGREGRGSFRS
jgi:hypothetical protein